MHDPQALDRPPQEPQRRLDVAFVEQAHGLLDLVPRQLQPEL